MLRDSFQSEIPTLNVSAILSIFIKVFFGLLAGVILEIIKSKEFREENQTTQIYHYSNEGEINWYEFAKEIFKIAKIDCKVNPITTQQYPAPAKRPRNTIMNSDKIIGTYNVKTLFWKASLDSSI